MILLSIPAQTFKSLLHHAKINLWKKEGFLQFFLDLILKTDLVCRNEGDTLWQMIFAASNNNFWWKNSFFTKKKFQVLAWQNVVLLITLCPNCQGFLFLSFKLSHYIHNKWCCLDSSFQASFIFLCKLYGHMGSFLVNTFIIVMP